MSLNEGFCKQINPAKGKMLLHVTQMKNLLILFITGFFRHHQFMHVWFCVWCVAVSYIWLRN